MRPDKTFAGELQRFDAMLARHERFTLSRFGDGEMVILMGDHRRRFKNIIGIEYQYEPHDPTYAAAREAMLAAFRYRACDYYIGISCPHCVGDDDFRWLVETSGQDEEHLTFATLWFYTNYRGYLARVVPRFREYQVILVCNREASIEELPFAPAEVFRVGRNAWRDDLPVIDALRRFIDRQRLRDALFLLCAGPFSGVIAHELHAFSPENSYVDIGSTLDPLFFPGEPTRRYLRSEVMLTEECDWRPLAVSGLASRPDL
jgi:hypothetical protein